MLATLDDSQAIRLFNSWSYEDVEIKDISLQDYIQIRHHVFLPHTAGRYQAKRFRKAQCPVVERLTNSLMMHGRNNGKKLMAVRIVKHAFEIIHLLTDQNPIQVAVDAIINTGVREDSTRIGSAGTVRRQAVDVSPLRRVNNAISLLTTGAREAAFRNVKTIAECLADELINAGKGSSNSYAIKKKDELERRVFSFSSCLFRAMSGGCARALVRSAASHTSTNHRFQIHLSLIAQSYPLRKPPTTKLHTNQPPLHNTESQSPTVNPPILVTCPTHTPHSFLLHKMYLLCTPMYW